ncbi:hypothetical protein B0H13DRAFT_2655795 [Mycena leptocephala]|nr:hypothetical protein B0H13DRAFT_2655795 [Mycena leptocephala]
MDRRTYPITVPRATISSSYRIFSSLEIGVEDLVKSSGVVLGAIKLDLVYISRLTATFLAHAREAGVRAASSQIDKRWRDPMFDRVMTGFFVGWMGCQDVFVKEFYKEFNDEEYKEDIVRRRWSQKVVCPGIGGFILTARDLRDGGDADEFLSGLTLDRDSLTFHYAPEVRPFSSPPFASADHCIYWIISFKSTWGVTRDPIYLFDISTRAKILRDSSQISTNRNKILAFFHPPGNFGPGVTLGKFDSTPEFPPQTSSPYWEVFLGSPASFQSPLLAHYKQAVSQFVLPLSHHYRPLAVALHMPPARLSFSLTHATFSPAAGLPTD